MWMSKVSTPVTRGEPVAVQDRASRTLHGLLREMVLTRLRRVTLVIQDLHLCEA